MCYVHLLPGKLLESIAHTQNNLAVIPVLVLHFVAL